MKPDARPDILFATIAAGGGHVATAEAMAEGLEALYPDTFAVHVSDYMKDLEFTAFDTRHKASWRQMLRYPVSARLGQRFIDRLPRLTVTLHRQLLNRFAEVAAAHLGATAPQLVVANHGFLTIALTQSQRRYGYRGRVLTFATEPFDASALWAEPAAEHFVVPSVAAMRDLVRMGVGSDTIDVVGYPVKQAFLHPPSKEEARATLGLKDRFTCLISLGGEGVGRGLDTLITRLLSETSAQLVVITGRNTALRRRLQSQQHERLYVEGFVTTMPTYLAACDVVVGKAGPASVMEALAVGRPVLVTQVAGLNEVKVMRFVEARGLGAYHPTPAGLVAAIKEYQGLPGRLEEATRRCAALDLPGMTERLAVYVGRYALHGPSTRRQHEDVWGA